MSKIATINISKFKKLSGKEPENLGLQTYFDWIKYGTNKEDVLTYRGLKESNPEKASEIKKAQPYVTPSATFANGRKMSDMQEHTGIIHLDIDSQVPETTVEAIRNDRFTLAVHRSIGGDGICVYYKINPDKHAESFLALSEYVLDKYNLISDAACKNINRIRYISYDPKIYVNQDAHKWTKTSVKKYEPKDTNYVFNDNDIDFILQQVKEQRIDLTSSSYYKYLRIGFALANKFGESGRDKYHLICSMSVDKYNERACNKQYDNCVQSAGHGVTIATLYYYAKEAGLEIYRPESKTIIKYAKVSKQQNVKKNAQELQEHVKTVIGYEVKPGDFEMFQQAFNKKVDEDPDKNNSLKLREFILDTYLPTYNEVKNKISIESVETFKNRDMYTIVQDCKEYFDFKVSQSDVTTVLNSKHVPSFNPIKDWFKENYNPEETYTNHIRKYYSFINFSEVGADDKEYYYHLMRKWFIGAVHNIFCDDCKEVSETVLVFQGKQGCGKTTLCRYIIPQELSDYYTERDIVTTDKDSIYQLCTNFVITFDELGGAISKDPEGFKKICSIDQVTQRRPYAPDDERFRRIASLLGTTNEDDIIRDITGNRRIIVFPVEGIQYENVVSFQPELLWMEAYQAYLNGENWNTNETSSRHMMDNINERFTEILTEEELVSKHFYFIDESKGANGSIPENSLSGEEVLNQTEILNHILELYPRTANKQDCKRAIKKLASEKNNLSKNRNGKRGYKIARLG